MVRDFFKELSHMIIKPPRNERTITLEKFTFKRLIR
jgi:hypothetical protein